MKNARPNYEEAQVILDFHPAKALSDPWRCYLLLSAVIAFFVVMACISYSPWPDDQDGVNYVLGVDLYDISFHRPHFPGYPVYIAAGKVLNTITDSPEKALILISILSGACSLILFFILFKRDIEKKRALLAVYILAFHPLYFEFSHKIFNESFALLFLISAIILFDEPASPLRTFLSGLLLGLQLGVRLSWWPYPFFYTLLSLKEKRGLSMLMGMSLGILLWIIPQGLTVGWGRFIDVGISFVIGHFTDWGGAIGPHTGWTSRLTSIYARVGEACGFLGKGTIWTRLPWLLFVISSIPEAVKKGIYPYRIKAFLCATLTYTLWASLGQNVDKVRHFVPIAPAIVLFAAANGSSWRKKSCLTAGLILSLTLPLDYAERSVYLSPPIQLKEWTETVTKKGSVFYCGNTERFFDLYNTRHSVISVPSAEKLKFIISSTWPSAASFFICSDIRGFSTDKEPYKVFIPRRGDPVDRTLKVYKF